MARREKVPVRHPVHQSFSGGGSIAAKGKKCRRKCSLSRRPISRPVSPHTASAAGKKVFAPPSPPLGRGGRAGETDSGHSARRNTLVAPRRPPRRAANRTGGESNPVEPHSRPAEDPNPGDGCVWALDEAPGWRVG
jgi:hypothetical protein